MISQLPGQVVTRQSAEVDYISGATQSTNAFYDAVREALTKAAPVSVAGGASRRERERYTHALMGTLVTIEVVGHDRDARARRERGERVTEAFEWFRRVEGVCTRFDPASELMRLTATIDVPVPVSDILFHAVEFACAVARETSGAFDPTVGHAMEQLGFDTAYDTGLVVHTPIAPSTRREYRDVLIDPDRQTVTLDAAARARSGRRRQGPGDRSGGRSAAAASRISPSTRAAICFSAGTTPTTRRGRWASGIHAKTGALLDYAAGVRCRRLYVRRLRASRAGRPRGPSHRPANVAAVRGVASVTVIAPKAMVADAFGTAAFVLGPDDGLALLERIGVDGLVVSTERLERFADGGNRSDAILSHA